ncbi:MAG: class I tRNA ligase family protein, partial [Anaerolineales bacterium]|nr:class I tRNA ligase family protein [Anaerolineales bacterium]
DDPRAAGLAGRHAVVPLFDQQVPILTDPAADPTKGTGVVMCCTFGDTADVAWWRQHDLPLVEAIGRDGRMTAAAGPYAGLPTAAARQQIIAAIAATGELLAQEPLAHSVRVHERCDTPVEYVIASQWFIRVLDDKEALLAAGEQIAWHPSHMHARYRQWVENLGWDWCISRQRYFGVTFPVWTCDGCGATILADEAVLPLDPTVTPPKRPCPACGGAAFTPEQDVMDTWFTSSMSPQIGGQWQPPGAGGDNALYAQVFPAALRPQAHEIIRTWAFYTIVKSRFHFDALPWRSVAISGWGLAPEGTAKLSKSRGGGPMPPLEMIALYSADALRYWAASTGPGKDAIISEEKIQAGARLATKLWHVARFSQRFLAADGAADGADEAPPPTALTPADRWILARAQQLIQRATALFEQYDYATAKSETEIFFWRDLADNYLEMAKQRLYDGGEAAAGARFALRAALLTTLKLFAPILPYVTEEIYLALFAASDGAPSIHRARWPRAEPRWQDDAALALGDALLEIATAVRRHKSEHGLSL